MLNPSGTTTTLSTAAKTKTERQPKALARAPAASGASSEPRPHPAMARPIVRPRSPVGALRIRWAIPAVKIKAMETPMTAVPNTKIG